MRDISLRFGALVDLIDAASAPAHDFADDADEAAWREARSATLRAVAVTIAGGYRDRFHRYTEIFYEIKALIDSDAPAPDIARALLDKYGTEAP